MKSGAKLGASPNLWEYGPSCPRRNTTASQQ